MSARSAALACAGLAALLVFAGCSGSKAKSEPPAALTAFPQTLKINKLWSASVGGKAKRLRLGLRPATDGARIYAGSHDGEATAFDAQSGKRVWSVKTRLPLAAGPAYGDGLIVFGTTDGEIIALDANTGVQQWRQATGSEVLAPPVVAQGIVVLRTLDGRLRGFSAKDGTVAWSIGQNLPPLTLRGNTAPRIAGEYVVTGFNNGRVGAYNLASGDAAWELALANPAGRSELERLVDVGAGLSVVGNDVYVVGYHGRVIGVDLNTGVLLWQQDMSSYAGLGADVSNVYVTSDVDAVIALDRRGGTQVWRQEALRLRDVTAPARYEGAVVVGDYQGYVHWLDATDGHLVAREHAAGERITAAPLVVGDNVYVQGEDGTVAAFTIRKPAA